VLFAFEDTLPILQQNWRYGVGIRNLMLEIAVAEPNTRPVLLPAHNTFVVVWTELGIGGLVLFTGGCAAAAWRAFNWKNPLSAVWGAAICALGMFLLFDYFIWLDARSTTLLFLTLGFGWGTAIIRAAK